MRLHQVSRQYTERKHKNSGVVNKIGMLSFRQQCSKRRQVSIDGGLFAQGMHLLLHGKRLALRLRSSAHAGMWTTRRIATRVRPMVCHMQNGRHSRLLWTSRPGCSDCWLCLEVHAACCYAQFPLDWYVAAAGVISTHPLYVRVCFMTKH